MGPKSGSLPAIRGSMSPEKSSVSWNRVALPSGFDRSEYVRTPRNSDGLPWRHTISSLGSKRVTLTLKVLPGASGTCILTIPPSAMSPSMLVSVEFQCTMSSTLVRIVHTFSGGAWISADTVHCIRKVDRVFTALISVVDIGSRVYAWVQVRLRHGLGQVDLVRAAHNDGGRDVPTCWPHWCTPSADQAA